MEELIDQLWWDDKGRSRCLVGVGDTPILSFRRDRQRVVTELAFMHGRRFIDVSVQPEAPGQLLRTAAISRRRDPNAWEAVVARRLIAQASAWAFRDGPDDCHRLASLVGGLAFPLIRMAEAHGVICPPFVPRWAEPVLSCADVGAAARTAFGDAASRRVVRTLPRSLIGRGQSEARSPALMPLAFALTLRGLLDPDGLANVLEADAAEHAPQHWPTVDELDELERAFHELGADSASAVVRDSLAHASGPRRLVTVAPHVRLLASMRAGPPPSTLEGLEEAVREIQRCAQVLERPPSRARLVEPPARARVIEPPQPAEPRPIRVALPAVPLHPPADPPPARPGEEFRYPVAAERIDGLRLGDHHLVLPRTEGQMTAWGAQLSNCIAGYVPAVAAGRSVVVGVHRQGRLVAALELDRSLSTVRQFVRDHNQRPHRAERDAVSRMLRYLGIGDRARRSG